MRCQTRLVARANTRDKEQYSRDQEHWDPTRSVNHYNQNLKCAV